MPPGQIQFSSDDQNEFKKPLQDTGTDFTSKLVSWGLVSSRDEAQYVLIGVAVLALAAAVFFFFSSGGGTPPPPPVNTPGL